MPTPDLPPHLPFSPSSPSPPPGPPLHLQARAVISLHSPKQPPPRPGARSALTPRRARARSGPAPPLIHTHTLPPALPLSAPAVPGGIISSPAAGGGAGRGGGTGTPRQTLHIRPGPSHLGRGQERLLWAAPGRGRAGPDAQIWRRPGPHSWGPAVAAARPDKRLGGRRRLHELPGEERGGLSASGPTRRARSQPR